MTNTWLKTLSYRVSLTGWIFVLVTFFAVAIAFIDHFSGHYGGFEKYCKKPPK